MYRPVCLGLFHIQPLHGPAVLLWCQHSGLSFIAGPLKASGLQPLVQQKESIVFPAQRLDSVLAPTAEQKQRIINGSN